MRPGGFFGEELTNLTLAGDFDEKRLDDMALRILTPHMHQKQDADDYPKVNFDSNTLADKGEFGTNEHVNVQVRPAILHPLIRTPSLR